MTQPHVDERYYLGGVSPQVINATLTNANTEYAVTLPTGTRHFSIKARTLSHQIKLSFEEGQSGTTYITLDGFSYFEPNVLAMGIVMYLQSPTAGCVVEIVVWS